MVQERTRIKNQLHTEKAEAQPNPNSIKRFQQRIKLLDQKEDAILEEIKQNVQQEPELKEHIKILTTVPP